MMPMPRGGKVTQVPTLESPIDCNAMWWAACVEDTKLQSRKQHWDLPLLHILVKKMRSQKNKDYDLKFKDDLSSLFMVRRTWLIM